MPACRTVPLCRRASAISDPRTRKDTAMTRDRVDLVFTFRVKPDEQDLYERAIDALLPVTERDEPYVLEYEIYRDAEDLYTQHERYVDEDAMFRHLEVTEAAQVDWAEATDVQQVFVLG